MCSNRTIFVGIERPKRNNETLLPPATLSPDVGNGNLDMSRDLRWSHSQAICLEQLGGP